MVNVMFDPATRRRLAWCVVVVLAVALGGCEGNTDTHGEGGASVGPSHGSGASAGPTPGGDAARMIELTPADVDFYHFQIAYHNQLIEIMELVPDRTDRTELIEFSSEEISFAESMITATEQVLVMAGEDPRPGQVDGLVGEADIRALEDLSGLDFDLAVLDVLRSHVDAEVEVAERVLEAGGTSQEVTDMANDAIDLYSTSLYDLWEESWSEVP